jgi:hypothetical protein
VCPHVLFMTWAGSPLLRQPGGPPLLGGHHMDANWHSTLHPRTPGLQRCSSLSFPISKDYRCVPPGPANKYRFTGTLSFHSYKSLRWLPILPYLIDEETKSLAILLLALLQLKNNLGFERRSFWFLSPGFGKLWPTAILSNEIKIYWDTALLIHLCIVYGCFHNTKTAE